jgi:hypothetical protein
MNVCLHITHIHFPQAIIVTQIQPVPVFCTRSYNNHCPFVFIIYMDKYRAYMTLTRVNKNVRCQPNVRYIEMILRVRYQSVS